MPRNKELEFQKREHAHQERMALFSWLSANDENILILGAISGFGVSSLSKAMGWTVNDDGAPVDDNGIVLPWFTGIGLIQWATGDGDPTKTAIMGSVQNSIAGMGNNVATMCMGLLILKNVGPALNGIGEMIPG